MSDGFNISDLTEIRKIFSPGKQIQVVFDIDTDRALVLPTVIYQCKHESDAVAIYQTRPEILPSQKYRTVHLAAIVEKELNQKVRLGLKCEIIKFLRDAKISE